MPSPVRGARVRQRESGVPEVPHQKACTTAVGFCRIGQGFIAVGSARRAMRILRRSARAGGMLDARHELDITPEREEPGRRRPGPYARVDPPSSFRQTDLRRRCGRRLPAQELPAAANILTVARDGGTSDSA